MPKEDFPKWLQDQLDAREWTQSDFARKTKISPATVSRVLSGMRQPGRGFCRSAARALGMPEADVFRAAGLLEELPDQDELIDNLIYIASNGTDEQKRQIIEMAKIIMGKK